MPGLILLLTARGQFEWIWFLLPERRDRHQYAYRAKRCRANHYNSDQPNPQQQQHHSASCHGASLFSSKQVAAASLGSYLTSVEEGHLYAITQEFLAA